MRKSLINNDQFTSTEEPCLDLEQLASVAFSSEADGFPIEAALMPGREGEWRAGTPGEQTLRIVFDVPVTVRRIQLIVTEQLCSRTQEFVLRWSGTDGILRDIVRQQYNFSPPFMCVERENYAVNLPSLKRLEVVLNPDISNPHAFASLTQLMLW